MSVIPSRMVLSAKMEAAKSLLSNALLTSLDVSDSPRLSVVNSVKLSPVTPSSTSEPLSQVLPKHTGSCGSICFVVRRPG